MRTREQDYQLLLEHLKASRKEAGVSQVELAVRLQDTQSFVSKVERGERRLDVVELIAFCEALGISTEIWLTEFLQRRKASHTRHGMKRELSM